MSTENEEFDIGNSLAAELTDSVGMDDVGNGMPDSVAADVADQEQYEAEKFIPVSDDVQDTEVAAEEREAEQEQAQQRGKKVPLAALHEERQKRQALELQVQAQAQQLQQFMAQQQALQQAQQQAAEQAAIPDFDEDPRGYIEAKEKQFAQALAQVQNGQGQQPQHQQQQVQQLEAAIHQEATVLAPVISEAEARFSQANPDYPQAFDHVMATVEQNMRTQHPGINEQQLGNLRTAALVTLAKQCQSNGQDVAAFVYQRAQAMGYQPASRAPRREAPTSLSNLAGSARAPDERGAMNVSQVSEMSEAEFDKFWSEMKQSSVQRPKF